MMVMGGQWGVKGGPLEVHEGSKGGMQNVFVHITKCICPNCKMYLSKLQNVFVQIAKLICPMYNVHLKIPGICGNILTINLLVATSTLSQVFSATEIKMLLENIVNATIICGI